MKEFNSLAGFATHLAELVVKEEVTALALMEGVGKLVERTAKAKIGDYQDQAGQFIAWPELAESTQRDREAQGYSADEPGLRSGDMRDKIEHNATPIAAHIGSNDDKLVWFELGTDKQPPRSALGGSLFEKKDEVLEIIGGGFTGYLAGQSVVNGKLKIE